MTQDHVEPLSWLLLERYALGELAAAERARVEAQIARSPADRACLESILNDASELPPLPESHHQPRRQRTRLRLPTRSALLPALVAAAAGLLLIHVAAPQRALDGSTPHARSKGGELELTLYSDRQGDRPTTFTPGERFKLFVSCPASSSAALEVTVLQGAERYQPLAAQPQFPCGNHVPWPGAFTLDGAHPAQVCVSWPADREKPPASDDRSDAGPRYVCVRLVPRP